MDRVHDAQKHLQRENIDGWLLYDFHGNNPLAREFLQIAPEQHTTRRFFYYIPAKGQPVKIQHAIEPHVLAALPGDELSYLRWQELEAQLKKAMQGAKKIAMEYSPRCAIPYLSKVDGGTVDLVRSLGVEVVSSASFLQYYTCVLDRRQLQTHMEAAAFLDETAQAAWEKIADALKKGKRIDEYQVSAFIAERMEQKGFATNALPICGVNAHSADPHYQPAKEGSTEIKRGDFVLIDLWCVKKEARAVYADICRVAVAGERATPKQLEIFSLVREAQKAGVEFILERYGKNRQVQGCEVDQVCRKIIEDKGYGAYFTHRTGHNIYTEPHGPGAHLDSLETLDLRQLAPHTCFSVEPGIYLPGEFGVRLEHDVYLGDAGEVRVTGGIQEEIKLLLA